MMFFVFFASFFFSSRRRHTRSLCDWSSDVCSSDLVSIFSANAGIASGAGVPVAAEGGEYAVRGTADGLVPASGVGVGDNCADVGGRGRGVCLATHHSHATNPMTQSITAIHAVRSIKLVAPAIHRAAIWQRFERKFLSGPDRVRNRPRADSAPAVSNRASPPK